MDTNSHKPWLNWIYQEVDGLYYLDVTGVAGVISEDVLYELWWNITTLNRAQQERINKELNEPLTSSQS